MFNWNIWVLEEEVIKRTSKEYLSTLKVLYPFYDEYIEELQKHLILPVKE